MRVKFAGRLLRDDLTDNIKYVCKCGREYWLSAETAGTEFRCLICGYTGIVYTPPTGDNAYWQGVAHDSASRPPQYPYPGTHASYQPQPGQIPQQQSGRQQGQQPGHVWPYPHPYYYPFAWPQQSRPAANDKPLTPPNPMKTGKLLCIIGGIALGTAIAIFIIALLLMP
jgi:DNA-directed RNA polymerase subunit RPC12/RpoP